MQVILIQGLLKYSENRFCVKTQTNFVAQGLVAQVAFLTL